MKKNKIIVIGAGYGGIKAVENLAKESSNEIHLFDIHPYHYMQTEVYDFIANETDFAQITVDLFTFCAGFNNSVTFHKEEIINIDFEKKKVMSLTQRYSYDYLVIATGSRTNFYDNIPGLKEYAYGIKTLKRAIYFKQKFEQSLFNKIEEEGSYCRPLNIIIGGAGLSGVEIAAQMASFANEFYAKNHYLCRKLSINLINAAPHILPGIEMRLVEASTKRLLDLGVIIKDGVKVTEVTDQSVTLSSGEVLPMDFMIFAGGLQPSKLIKKLELPKNERGFLLIDEYLRLSGYEHVFAIGDCASLKSSNKAIAPTADVAEQMGELCAHNIMRCIKNQPLKQHSIASRGLLIALGRRYAAGKIGSLYVSGFIGFILKKIVEKGYSYLLMHRSKKGSIKIFDNKL